MSAQRSSLWLLAIAVAASGAYWGSRAAVQSLQSRDDAYLIHSRDALVPDDVRERSEVAAALAHIAGAGGKPELERTAFGRFLKHHPDCMFSHQVRRFTTYLRHVVLHIRMTAALAKTQEWHQARQDDTNVAWTVRDRLRGQGVVEVTEEEPHDGVLDLELRGSGQSGDYVPLHENGPRERSERLYTGASIEGTMRLIVGTRTFSGAFTGRAPMPFGVKSGEGGPREVDAPFDLAVRDSGIGWWTIELVERAWGEKRRFTYRGNGRFSLNDADRIDTTYVRRQRLLGAGEHILYYETFGKPAPAVILTTKRVLYDPRGITAASESIAIEDIDDVAATLADAKGCLMRIRSKSGRSIAFASPINWSFNDYLLAAWKSPPPAPS